MNSTSSASSRIVVGVALAAVFGAGVYVYGVRAAHDAKVAQATPVAAPAVTPPPAPAAPPDALAQASANPAVSAEAAPVTPPSATPPAPVVAQNDAAPTPAATPDTATPAKKKHVAKHALDSDSTRNTETAANTSSKSAAGNSDSANSVAATPPAPPAAAPPSAAAPPVASTEAPPAPATSGQDAAATSPPATADAGTSDNKISTDVKSQIAAAAPNSNVNVTTTNGAVALAGSVPSQDAVNQAKQAALSVQGVKTVDTSGLLVNNN